MTLNSPVFEPVMKHLNLVKELKQCFVPTVVKYSCYLAVYSQLD